VLIGFLLMVLGLGMSNTLVMLPVGLTLGLLGVLLVVGGLFAHVEKPEQLGDRR
jgi:hypothetical protein